MPLEEPPNERFIQSESYASSLPVQYKRLEKFKIVSVSGTDKVGRPVIVVSACRLPPSYQISHEVLLEYLKYTLDQYVESDYTLVYFHHGLSSLNKPSLSWIYQVYKELDRK
jgi:Rho GTPase-activating protein 1